MEQDRPDASIANDVLHSDGHQSKLTPEEIAKAVAHHKRHHGGDQQQSAQAKNEPPKKPGAQKTK